MELRQDGETASLRILQRSRFVAQALGSCLISGTGYYDNENDCDLPLIKQLLYTTLQKDGFAVEDQRQNNTAYGVGDVTIKERGGSLDNGSAAGDNSGGSLRDLIVLLGDDNSSASEHEVDDSSLHTESETADEGLLDSLKTAIESKTPCPPSNPDMCRDINNFLETAQRLQRSKQNPSTSTSDSMRPHTSFSSRSLSELLHKHTSTAGQSTSHFSLPILKSQYCKLVEDEKAEDARPLKAALRRRRRGHEDVPDSESENEVEAYVTNRDDDDDDKLTPSAQL
ncbi:hypothetical protein DL98DRAFT_542612 [Cadophora sp. DSE1049]|nr:hypothetical protein DL98DRAFT_542612 [Cadophora sp. DSE1049]